MRFHRIVPMAAVLLFCCWGGGWSHLYGQGSCQITGMTSLCQNGEAQYQLTHNVAPPFQVDWQVIGGAPISQGPSGITVGWPLSGVHQIIATITGSGGSQTVCNLLVDVLPSPTVPALPELTTCIGQTEQVSTTSCTGCTYNWTTQGALSISPTDQPAAALTINGNGQYCVQVTDASGCSNSACGNAILASTQIIPVTIAGAASTTVPNHWEVCPNQPVNFSVANPTVLSWVITDGTTYWNLSGPEITFEFPTPGSTDYVVTGTYLDYKIDNEPPLCVAIEPQYIHVNALNPIPISCPSVVCAGDEVTYTVPAGCSGTWSVSPQGNIVGIPTATSVTVVWSYDSSDPDGYVIYTGTCPGMGYCTGPSIVQVPIIPNVGTINGLGAVCSLPKTLSWNTTNFVGGEYTWSYSPFPSAGVVVEQPNGPNSYRLKFTTDFQGPITIRLEFKHPIAGCSYVVEKVISYAPFSGIIAGPGTICADDVDEPHNYTFNYAGNLTWKLSKSGEPPFLTGNSTPPNSFTIPANTLEPGNDYILTVSSDQGCSSSKSIIVQPTLHGKIEGPTTVCADVNYTYTGTPSLGQNESFIWVITQNGGNPLLVNSPTLNISWPAGTGSLELRRKMDGCTAVVDHVDMTIVSPGDPLILSGPDATCSDIIQNYSVSPAVSGTNYVWTITDPGTGLISNAGSIYSGQGTSTVEVQWLGATSPTVVNLNVSAEICGVPVTTSMTVTISPFHLTLETPDICEGEAGQMTINASSGDGYTLYVDGHVVYSNSANLLPISPLYLPAGTHTILLVVQNPNGCAGPATASSTIEVHPNASFKISLSDLLPCPKNTPFVRQLTVSPSSPNCTYQWYRNGLPFGTGPLVNITSVGTYTVVSHCGDCPSKSATLELKYDCGECCELDVEGNDILVDMKGCSLSPTECNLIRFGGKITPFQLAHNPHWTIEQPGGTFVTIPITSAGTNGVVTGTYQATAVGIYRVYLTADEVWKDVTIRVPVGHGHYILFADFCQFEDAGGANTYPNYQVIQTGQDAYCPHSDYCNIQVPFIADFTYQILCNEDGTFQVHADDNSLYDTGVSATIEWTYPGGTHTGSSVNVPSVAALTQFDLCMKVTDQHGYSCSHCETIHTPAQVSPGINVASLTLCEDQGFQFSPIIYPPGSTSSVVSYHWTFGDGSFSYAETPNKVYTEPGTYTVTLIVETLNGCFLSTSITVTVNKNELPDGEIVVVPDDCNSSATLTFKQTAGPSVVDYLWTPAAPNAASIVATADGTYGLVVTANNGCSNTIDPVQVDLKEPFPSGINKHEECGNVYASFTINPAYSYSWTWSPATPDLNQPVLGSYLAFATLVPGTYQVTVTAIRNDVPCLTKEIEITVFPNPVTPEVTQEVICADGQMWVKLTATNIPAGATVLWSGPGGINIPGASSILVSSNGYYSVSYKNAFGCYSSLSIPVNNLIDFSTFLSGCYDCHILDNNQEVKLYGIPGVFDSWYWEIDGVPSPTFNGQHSTITPLVLLPTYHKIRLCVTQAGCSLCSDLFCLIGDCDTTPCLTMVLGEVRCFDNGTADPTDDYWNFDVTVSGGPAGSYWYSDPPTSQFGPYNAVKTVWVGQIATSGTTYTLTVHDYLHPECTGTITVQVPAPCSRPCELRTSVQVGECNNNGTPYLISDDYYYVTIQVSGTNGQCWMAKQKKADGTEVLLGTYTTNLPVTLGPFNILDGNWTLWVFVCGQVDCVQDLFIEAPRICSGCHGIAITNVTCYNNGTSITSDDTWSFDLLVNGGSVGGFWIASPPVNQSGPYGVVKTIYMGLISQSGGQIQFTVTDSKNPNCRTEVIVPVPRACSDSCALHSTAQVGSCVFQEGRWVYYVTATVTGTGCWMAKQKFNNGTEIILGTYYTNQPVVLGPFDPAQGDWTLWLFRCGTMDCFQDFFIDAPPCNTKPAPREAGNIVKSADFQWYPSPVVSELIVKDLRTPVASGIEKIGFVVSDMLGKPVFRSTEDAGGEYRLNLESLTPGMYMLQVLEQGKLLPVGRFVKI